MDGLLSVIAETLNTDKDTVSFWGQVIGLGLVFIGFMPLFYRLRSKLGYKGGDDGFVDFDSFDV